MEASRPSVRLAESGPDGGGEPVADGVSEEFRSRRSQHYDEVSAVRSFQSEEDGAAGAGGDESDEEASPVGPDKLDCGPNPMEPRPGGIAFQVSPATTQDQGPNSAQAAVRAHRQSHYRGMAAALRSAP